MLPGVGIVDSLFSGSLVLCFFIGTIATLDGRLEVKIAIF